MSIQPLSPGRSTLLWDGACGFCGRCVAWIRARDHARQFEPIPYQDADLTPERRAACAKAVHVITADGRVLAAGRACLFVLGRIGWPRVARLLSLPPFIWAVELGYRIVARHRPLFDRLVFGR